MNVVRATLTSCLLFLFFRCEIKSDAQATKALLLFGGEDHKAFLGCLNCSPLNDDSVCNRFGKYGSKFQENSIWNRFAKFGSKFEESSPWNRFSTEAPIIVDKDGQPYGYFSMNPFHPDRTHLKWLVEILDYQQENDDLDMTRDKTCGD